MIRAKTDHSRVTRSRASQPAHPPPSSKQADPAVGYYAAILTPV
jgi:hypothetical protein